MSRQLKAVILAAGASTRTRPLTFTRPKPLLPFFEKTFLEYTLDCLVGVVSEVIIAEYFLAEQIQEKIGNEYKGMKIHHMNIQGTPGTGGTMTRIRKKFEPPFLVLNGDDIYSAKDIRNLAKHDRAVLISKKIAQSRTLDGWNTQDGHVISLGQKENNCEWGVATGGYVLSEDYFETKEQKVPGREEVGLPHTLAKSPHLHEYVAVFVEDIWFPVGYPWDILKLHDIFSKPQTTTPILGKNIRIGKNTLVTHSIIFDNVTIGDNCTITDSIIGANVTVGNGVIINNVKEDGSTWRTNINGEDIDTGETHLGVFVGDYSTIKDGSILQGATLIDAPQDTIPK